MSVSRKLFAVTACSGAFSVTRWGRIEEVTADQDVTDIVCQLVHGRVTKSQSLLVQIDAAI